MARVSGTAVNGAPPRKSLGCNSKSKKLVKTRGRENAGSGKVRNHSYRGSKRKRDHVGIRTAIPEKDCRRNSP